MSNFKEKALSLSKLLAESLVNDLYFLDVARLRQGLRTAHANPEVQFVSVRDLQGRVLVEVDAGKNRIRGERRNLLRDGLATVDRWTSRVEAGLLKIRGPIVLPDKSPIGQLDLEFSLRSAYEIAEEQARFGFQLTSIFIVIGALLAFVISRRFTRPIVAVMEAAKEIGSGDLSKRIRIERRDELGMLGESINAMAAALRTSQRQAKQAEDEIRKFNGELERRVVERTAQFESANKELSEEFAERRSAQEALSQSESRNRAILDSALDCIVTIDSNGQIVEFNPAAEKTLGYSRSEAMGKLMVDLIVPPRLREAHRRGFTHYFATGRGSMLGNRLETIAVRADGSEFPVELSIVPIATATQPLFTGFIRDITVRKKNERDMKVALQEQQTLQEISQAILAADDPKIGLEIVLQKCATVIDFDFGTVLLTDPDGEITDVLAAWGYRDPANLKRRPRQGSRVRSLRFERPVVIENIQASDGMRTLKKEGAHTALAIPICSGDQKLGLLQLASRKPRQFLPNEITLAEAVGYQVGIAIQKAKLFAETKSSLQRIEALHEINLSATSSLELKTVLELLLEKIEIAFPYFAIASLRLLDHSSGELELMACKNITVEVIKANSTQAKMPFARIAFQSKAPLIVTDVQNDPRCSDPDFFRSHGLVSYLGVRLEAKDETLGVLSLMTGKQREFSKAEIDFLTLIAGQAAMAIYNARLYEQIKKQATELELANKGKDEFLSVMSHELRTPLNVIMGYAQILSEGVMGEITDEQTIGLQKIILHSTELFRLISDILQVGSIEAGKVRMQFEDVDIEDLLAELRSAYEITAKKELSLHWSVSPALPVIKTDAARLKHVLQNLIHNAIKFTEKGSVTVSARVVSGAMEFEVKDTGVGIEEEKLPTIFEMFRQVDSSVTRSYGGVGVGLYIVKIFTELLHGKIKVQSVLDQGSTFTVTLPLEVPQESIATQREGSAIALGA